MEPDFQVALPRQSDEFYTLFWALRKADELGYIREWSSDDPFKFDHLVRVWWNK